MIGSGKRSRRIGTAVVVVVLVSLFIAAGFVAFGIVTTTMQGRELANKIVGVNGHIFVQAAETPFTTFDTVADQTMRLPGVQVAIPFVEAAAGVASASSQAGALVRGIREKDLKALPGLAGRLETGSFDGFDKARGVAIGQGLAEALGLSVGDSLSVIAVKGPHTAFGEQPRIESYQIVATFRIGIPQFDRIFVFMPLAEAQTFFNHENEATVIEVFLKDATDIDTVRQAIDATSTQPLVLTDWRERNKTFFAAFRTELDYEYLMCALLLSAILGIIILAWRMRLPAGHAAEPHSDHSRAE